MPKAKNRSELQGYRRAFNTIFSYGAWLLVVVVLVQLFFAGGGTFARDFDMHTGMSTWISGLATVLLVIAVVARQSWQTVAGGLLIVLLIEGVQRAVTGSAWGDYTLGGIHALSGATILLLAVWLGYRTSRK